MADDKNTLADRSTLAIMLKHPWTNLFFLWLQMLKSYQLDLQAAAAVFHETVCVYIHFYNVIVLNWLI